MIGQFYKIAHICKRIVQRCLNMSTVGVKALIINRNMEILLVKHTYMPGWHLPGGGLNPGESPKDAIIREIKEEAAISVKGTLELFHVYAHLILGASDYPILYIIREFEMLPHKPDPKEIAQTKWFHYQALPQDASSSTFERVKEVFDQLPPMDRW